MGMDLPAEPVPLCEPGSGLPIPPETLTIKISKVWNSPLEVTHLSSGSQTHIKIEVKPHDLVRGIGGDGRLYTNTTERIKTSGPAIGPKSTARLRAIRSIHGAAI